MTRTADALHLALTNNRGRGGPVGLDRGLGSCMDIDHICGAIQHLWLQVDIVRHAHPYLMIAAAQNSHHMPASESASCGRRA